MKPDAPLPEEQITDKKLRRRTVVAFLWFGGATIGGWKLFSWIKASPKKAGVAGPLRESLTATESVASALFDGDKLVKEYPASDAAKQVRVNGNLGLRTANDAAAWRLQVQRSIGEALAVSLDELRTLPKKEVIFNFKCIEGWSQVSRWAGVPLKTFLEHYGLTQEMRSAYIGLATPDKQYYVGIDMPSALHPQTLLAYEVNGSLLPVAHGAPLRLIIPVKYGIKHLKRVGNMNFSNSKPADYWAERGYDYYAGH